MKRAQEMEFRLPFTDAGLPVTFEKRRRLVEVARYIETLALYDRDQLPTRIIIEHAPIKEHYPEGWTIRREWD